MLGLFRAAAGHCPQLLCAGSFPGPHADLHAWEPCTVTDGQCLQTHRERWSHGSCFSWSRPSNQHPSLLGNWEGAAPSLEGGPQRGRGLSGGMRSQQGHGAAGPAAGLIP